MVRTYPKNKGTLMIILKILLLLIYHNGIKTHLSLRNVSQIKPKFIAEAKNNSKGINVM